MDRTATNYNPNATIDDESCVYGEPSRIIYGCTNPKANNYNPLATIDDGSCVVPVPTIYGCLESTQFNYAGENNLNNIDPPANEACSGPTPTNYGGSGCLPPHCTGPWVQGVSAGCCEPFVMGCMDDGTNSNYPGRPSGYTCSTCNPINSATNYFSGANTENNSCVYSIPCPTQGVGPVSSPVVTNTSISLQWYAVLGSGIESFDVNYRVQGTTSWTPGCASVSGPSFACTISGLSPGTDYDVQIISICGENSTNSTYPIFTVTTTST